MKRRGAAAALVVCVVCIACADPGPPDDGESDYAPAPSALGDAFVGAGGAEGAGGTATGGAVSGGAPAGDASGPSGGGGSPGADAAAAPPPDDCGADLQNDPLNCGFCGRTCVVPNATAGCVAGQCVVATCDPDFHDRDANPANGCEAEELCQAGTPCPTACGGQGAIDCASGEPVCAAPAEACNALDDNCDGACDEGPVPGCRVAVHRGVGNGHVYSTDLAFVSNAPYRLESQGFFHLYAEPSGGMRPVFLCLKGNGMRFLTSENACEIGVGPERTLGFWSPEPVCGAIPLYRLYSPASGDHFYTTSAPERDNAISAYGYRDEGVAGHVWPGP